MKMEALENPTEVNSPIDNQDALNNDAVNSSNEEKSCHTTNNDAESLVTIPSTQETVLVESMTTENAEMESENVNSAVSSENVVTVDAVNNEHLSEIPLPEKVDIDTVLTTVSVQTNKEANIETNPNDHAPSGTNEEITEVSLGEPEKILYNDDEIHTEELIEVSNTEVINDKVTFQTEILIEKNYDDEVNSDIITTTNDTTNILNELGQSIEFTEALCSSDAVENVENNNCTGKQEVFNKEELLDILEGNDETEGQTDGKVENFQNKVLDGSKLEAQLALEQLSRLAKGRRKDVGRRRKAKNIERQPRKSRNHTSETNGINVSEDNKQNSIVNVLVKEWEDDEPLEEKSNVVLEEDNNLLENSKKLVKVQETVINQDDTKAVVDTSVVDLNEENLSHLDKSGDENQPQKRLSRVIKKKVIFDPDNPDTFTKNKTINKNKDNKHEKLHVTKKIKVDQVQQKSPSKSPTNKLQWKKPTPKNSKQYKRLTEVDKLLMDEGAVNMIYQLTPEAHKGKKNVKTKAEFIKKLQSSTPDGKEMKFRERKKELSKTEEGEAKKIIGGKRSSLSSSVKSVSAYEDFETHSADDSIIYRRHSSSSYSSACMSPRRLSDVDSATGQSMVRMPQQSTQSEKTNMNAEKKSDTVDVFMADTNDTSTDVINKKDCLSIKEKLNTKLSHVLNKRKRDSSKIEKPAKQKKMFKGEDKDQSPKNVEQTSFKFLTISFDDRLAEILIRKTVPSYNIETLKELKQALEYVDNKKDISVTLLTSECGTLCSSFDLKLLLDENMERRVNYAYEIAESARSLLSSMKQHSKLLCTGVWGACSGLAPALVALSDVATATHDASFALTATPPLPGVAVFTDHSSILPRNLINDLVLFGRRLSAAEAMQCGLVNHIVLPGVFMSQLRSLVKDLASQQVQTLLLKKKLLSLNKSNLDSTFQSCLESERDMLVEYWTSDGGQEVLRAALNDG